MSEPADYRQRIPAFDSEEDYRRTLLRLRKTLAERQRTLGRDHPDVIAAREEIGLAYLGAGKNRRAVAEFLRNLRERRRTMPDDHPDTLSTASNLAMAYQQSGALARAIPLQEKILSDRWRVLGDDHDDTQLTRNNLGMAYQSRGLTQPAIAVYEQALTIGLACLGEDAYAGESAGNLGSAYRARAAAQLAELLPDCRRRLGARHSLTRAVDRELRRLRLALAERT